MFGIQNGNKNFTLKYLTKDGFLKHFLLLVNYNVNSLQAKIKKKQDNRLCCERNIEKQTVNVDEKKIRTSSHKL